MSSMAESQSLVPNLNEMIEEYTAGEEEIHLEPQTETTQVAEPEVQKEAQNPAHKERKKKRVEKSRAKQAKKVEDNEAFISDESYSFWKENLSYKGFIRERGFSTFISPFSEITENRGWNLFCNHNPPGYAAVVREFYSNMIDMKEDAVYVRGVWVPMGHEKIDEVLQIKDPKNGSKYKKLVREPNHKKNSGFLDWWEGEMELNEEKSS